MRSKPPFLKVIKELGPGLALIFCAFWVGTLPSMVFSFFGFLSFFVAGVTLVMEGWKKIEDGKPAKKEKP